MSFRLIKKNPSFKGTPMNEGFFIIHNICFLLFVVIYVFSF